MATIDLIVLGMIKQEPLSAYEIQKRVEYRNISRWVKISTPSIYKKVIKLEEKGYIASTLVKAGNMAEKAIYSLTVQGEVELKRLMLEISVQPIHIFLDFNAVVVNLEHLSKEDQKLCLDNISNQLEILKRNLEENFETKAHLTDIPATGKAVLEQQYILVEAIEKWLIAARGRIAE